MSIYIYEKSKCDCFAEKINNNKFYKFFAGFLVAIFIQLPVFISLLSFMALFAGPGFAILAVFGLITGTLDTHQYACIEMFYLFLYPYFLILILADDYLKKRLKCHTWGREWDWYDCL